MTVVSVVRHEDQACCYRSTTGTGLRVLWEMTTACNLRCGFCLVPRRGPPLPVAEARRIAAELVEAGVEKVLLSGGEPLLYPGLEEIIRFLTGRGVLVKILTNGSVRNDAVLELVRNTPGIEVSLSLEASDPETSDRIFGRPGVHATIMETLRALPKRRVHINTVCSKLNQSAVPGLIDWAAAEGVGSLTLINVFQNPAVSGRFTDHCIDYRLGPAEQDTLFSLVEAKRRQHGDHLAIRTLHFRACVGEHCGAGRSVLYVNAEGMLLPCTLTDNRDYAEAVRGMAVAQALAHYRDSLPDRPPSSCDRLLAGA